MYSADNQQTRPTPKAGDKCKAVVERIEAGVLSDFVAADALAKWNSADPQQPAIRVVARTEDGFERKKTMPYDKNGQNHPKSNIARWAQIYGKFPYEGQEIFMIADAEGYFQFYI